MKPLIIANWKCNPETQKVAEELFNEIESGVKETNAETVICPPFVYLSNIYHLKPKTQLGAQDCFWLQKGAYTGEVSPAMLKDLGCNYIIVGHSERRTHFKETDETVNKKLKAVLEAGLNPILCVGETKEERSRGEAEAVLKRQIVFAFKDIPGSKISKDFSIAYEPVWAIGTGNPCDADEAQKMGILIRKLLSEIYNSQISQNIRILYGGSVNSKNAAKYVKEAGLQGLLVGGASLDAKDFLAIIKSLGQ